MRLKSILKAVAPVSVLRFYRGLKVKNNGIRLYLDNKRLSINVKNNKINGAVGLVYWDGVENMGDSIGPYIITKITNRPVVNIMDTGISGFVSVGSILHLIDRKNMIVIGSGFIDKPSLDVQRNLMKFKPKVLTVRGEGTAKELYNLGLRLHNSDALGDPALMLPKLYSPTLCQGSNNKVGIVPHYIHKQLFIKNYGADKVVIDVQRDVESVVDQISSVRVCISTSLHGLILAQAYNVPWVWLEIIDDNLTGNDFKFNDFFSMLDMDKVDNHIQVRAENIAELDFSEIASKSCLPKPKYNVDKMFEVFIDALSEFDGKER